jgi:glucose-6-phosphate isomerase
MESLGKERDLEGQIVQQGLTVFGNKGSTDQHAFVQQLREGVPNFFATFVEVLEHREGPSVEVEEGITSGDFLAGFVHGTRQALTDKLRDSVTITIPRVSPRTVGALVALFERAVGLYASLIRVNAYHQPGVEAGKKAASAYLELQRKVVGVLRASDRPLTIAELAGKCGASDDPEGVYRIVRHLEANRRGVSLSGDRAKPSTLTVSGPPKG